MERREFLQQAGVGSAVVASAVAFGSVAWADNNGGRTGFIVQAVSGQTATINGGESIILGGCGSFGKSSARGGGSFVHFDGTMIPSTDFIATGEWKAKKLLSFTEIGTFGVAVAGIAEFEIRLLPCGARSVPAMLKIVCNIGPAGLINSPFQQEGFTLTVPGLTPFAPFTPNLGLTLFTRSCRELEDD